VSSNFTYKRNIIKKIGLLWLAPIFIPFFIEDIFSIFTVIFFFFVIDYKIKFNIKIEKSILWFGFFLLYAFIISQFKDVSNDYFTKYFIYFSQGFLVFFIMSTVYDSRDIEWLIKWIIFFTVIAFIIGIIQKKLGLGRVEIIYDISTATITEHTRPIPVGYDPNYYYLHLILPFVFCVTKYIKSEIFKIKYLYLFLTFLFTYNIIMTASKSAMIISVFLFVLTFFNSSKNTFRLIFFLILFYIIVLPILQDLYPYSFYRYQTMFESLNKSNVDNATSNRTIVWWMSIKNFFTHPFFGAGLGQIVKEYSSNNYLASIGAGTTHSSILHTLTEMGIFGFFLLYIPFIQILRKIRLNSKLLYIALLGVLIMTLTIDAMYYKVVYVILALCVMYNKKNDEIRT
jgi:hypothetical protein